ncbi:MAG: hypothetical protein AVDCRST_MAG13-3571, partial [uncultured Solirubrobacteraceae bacterium]
EAHPRLRQGLLLRPLGGLSHPPRRLGDPRPGRDRVRLRHGPRARLVRHVRPGHRRAEGPPHRRAPGRRGGRPGRRGTLHRLGRVRPPGPPRGASGARV